VTAKLFRHETVKLLGRKPTVCSLNKLRIDNVKSNAHEFKCANVRYDQRNKHKYEGWNFNSGNYLFTTDTK